MFYFYGNWLDDRYRLHPAAPVFKHVFGPFCGTWDLYNNSYCNCYGINAQGSCFHCHGWGSRWANGAVYFVKSCQNNLFVPITVVAYLYLGLTYGGYPYLIRLLVPKKHRGI